MRLLYAFSLLLALGLGRSVHAQQPFLKYGVTVKVATLSNGRFQEFFTNDSLRRIGSVVYDTRLHRVAYLLPPDSLVGHAKPDITSRWISPDPLAEKDNFISPYAFARDNAIRYNDPDGREVVGDPPKPKTIMVFYHGGPTGNGQIKRTSKDDTGGTGRIYDAAMQTARKSGDAVGAIIAPALVAEPGVATGTDFLSKNYVSGDKVIVYGYSYGGDDAVNLADNAKKLGIPITALVTVDSNDGPGQGTTVNSTVPDNVNSALNVYQTQASGQSSSSQSSLGGTSESQAGTSNSPGSHGYPATAGGRNRVQNVNATAPGVTHGNIQDRQRSTIMSFLNSYLH